MTKIAVGGTDGLIDRLIARMGWAPSTVTTDAQRHDCLKALNEAERYISQKEIGALYLSMRAPLALTNNTSSVALPTTPAIDFGKDLTLETPDGLGALPYKPADQLPAVAAPSFDRISSGTPSFFTIALAADGLTMTAFFKPGNTSGGTLVYTLTCQRAVIDLTDGGSVTSLLPEGYELTLLLDRAESQLRRLDSAPGWSDLEARVESGIQAFYSGYRTNKQKATSDAGQERRKIEDEQLADGK